jgi:hypothetical protein
MHQDQTSWIILQAWEDVQWVGQTVQRYGNHTYFQMHFSIREIMSTRCLSDATQTNRNRWQFDIGHSLKQPHYLSRVVYVRKIRTRRQRTDIRKFSFVNRTIGDWNQLPAQVLETLPCKSTTFRKRLRKVITEWHQGTPKWAKSIG